MNQVSTTENNKPVINLSSGKIPHNRWTVSPEQEEIIDLFLAQLKQDIIQSMVDNPEKPSNMFEVVGKMSAEHTDFVNAVYSGATYRAKFELYDAAKKAVRFALDTKHFVSITR